MGNALAIVRAPEAAEVLMEPKKRRILEELRRGDNSASGLARVLEMPRQKINYHLHLLEQAGLIEPVGEERKGKTSERKVRAKASYFLISPEAMEGLAPGESIPPDQYSAAYLARSMSRVVAEVGQLAVDSRKAGKRIATLTAEVEIRFRNAGERAEFGRNLAQFLAGQAAVYHDADAEGGRWFRVVAGAYPKITKKRSGGQEAGLLEEESDGERTEARASGEGDSGRVVEADLDR